MITLIRPDLPEQVKKLKNDLAQTTDNEVDDAAVEFIRNGLFPAKPLD